MSANIKETMDANEFNELGDREKVHFYECAVCGQMVDKRQLDDVVFHEDHVERIDIQYSGFERLD
jgi:hypothetical protein